MGAIRVFLADDHPVVRSGLQMAISMDAALEVVGEADNGQSAIEQIEKLNPDVAILDIGMPVIDGICATRELHKRKHGVKIALLTAHQGEDLFHAAMQAGANGFLIKDNALLEITNCVRVIASGGFYVTRTMAEHWMAGPVTGAAKPAQPLAQLAPVERRIVRLIAAQRSTKDIAGELGLSVRSIENRRSLICEKLGLSGVNSLLKFAIENKNQIA